MLPASLMSHRFLKGLFEIHVTVKASSLSVKKFSECCAELNTKPIIIALPVGTHQRQVQSGSCVYGTLQQAFIVMAEQHRVFATAGLEILRGKIEYKLGTSKDADKLVPKTNLRALFRPNNRYLEYHYKIVLHSARLPELKALAMCHGAHMSRNIYARLHNERGEVVQFLTLRFFRTGTIEGRRLFLALDHALTDNGFKVKKTECEYACFDSNTDIDAGWIATR